MQDVWQDVRYAARVLARAPGFTLVALLAIALGIGANSAIFTVVNSILLRPLNYPEPGRLVLVVRDFKGGISETLSAKKYLFVRSHTKLLQDLAAMDVLGVGLNLTGDGEPERVPSIRVTASLFDVLGVKPALGRSFVKEEDEPNGPRAVVISDGLWKRRFGGDRAILGRAINLGSELWTVVGVMPAGFSTTPPADVWTPLRAVDDPTDRANMFLIMGRLKPGVAVEQANREQDQIYQGFRGEFPNLRDGDNESFAALNYHAYLTGDVRTPLLVLMSAVGLVLLIACANVANLLLARATGRQREVAVRSALGAGSRRILRQLLTESILLSLAGGLLGLGLAYAGLQALLAAFGTNMPQLADVRMEAPVLWFTAGIAVLTGVVFGLAPALQSMRTDLNDSLRESSGRTAGSAKHNRMRGILVAAEVALAVVLLCGATLLMRTFQNLRNVQPGFDARNVLTFQLALGSRYKTPEQVSDFMRRLVERLESIPGTQAAGLVTNLPMELGPDLPFEIPSKGSENYSALWRYASPHYFDAMKIPVLQGRAFTVNDTAASESVILINETLARRFFAGRNPIGERILIGRIMGPAMADKPRQIVGVVGDVRERGFDHDIEPVYYIPTPQIQANMMEKIQALIPFTIVIRTSGPPMSSAESVRREVLVLDREQPVANLRPLEMVMANSLAQRRFSMTLLTLFAALALALASVGIYGVLSYAVSRRTQEIGVRMALGAGMGDVLRLVLGESLRPALLGLGAGLAAALALSQFLTSMLVGVSARDPLSFVAVPVVLLAVSTIAALVPALRATRIHPSTALRYE